MIINLKTLSCKLQQTRYLFAIFVPQSFLLQGCHSQGKIKIFQGQGKVREFFKKSGKIFNIGKVSEKSGNSASRFTTNKFSARFFNTFSS